MTPRGVASPLARPLAVTLYFASHALGAALLALPTAALVAGTGVGRFSEGDRLLFEPGGVALSEVARLLSSVASSHVASSLGTGTLVGMLLLVPHAALLVSLSRAEREPLAVTHGRAIQHLPTLLSLSGLALLAQVILLLGTFTLAFELRGSLTAWTTRNADLACISALALGLLVTLAVGIVRDLGRAAAVRGSLDSKAALLFGMKTFARAPGRSLGGWAAPAAAGLALVALGAVLTAALDVSRPGAWRVSLVALVHQAIAYGLCWCRAFWLSRSLGIVGRNTPIVISSPD